MTLGRLVLACVLLVCQGQVAARALAHASQELAQIDRQLVEADRLVSDRKYDAAEAVYDRALSEARERVADRQIAHALTGRADLRLRARRYDDGLVEGREALAIYDRLDDRPGIARASLLLSFLEQGAGRRAESKQYAERSLTLFIELGDRQGEARARLRVADLTTDLTTLRSLTDKTATVAREIKDYDTEGRALHRLGDALFRAEDYEESLRVLLEAKRAFEQANDPIDLGTVHNSIGRVYRVHGRLDEALREQQRALALHQRTDTDSARTARVQSLNAVAVSYQRLGDLESARSYLEQALALAPSVNLARAQDFLQANMASVLADLGQNDQAAAMLEDVIARGRDAFLPLRYAQLSQVYTPLGRIEEALAAAEKALATCGSDRSVCATSYYARAEAEAAKGDRRAARADLSNALALIEQLRAQLVPADFFRQEFHRFYQRGYAAAIAMDHADGEAARAMEVAEQARARAFLDLLASRSLPPAPDSTSRTVPLTLRNGDGEGTLPRAESVTATPASAADLVATARRLGSTLVAYWVDTDETFVWVLDGSGRVVSERIAVTRARLAQLVRQTAPFADREPNATTPPTPALVTRGQSTVSLASGGTAWRELYTVLVAPIRHRLPTTAGALLTIVPHDVLSSLSFAALQGPRGRYLLEDYTLHYAPAGAMFQFTESRRQPDARTRGMMLVADPVPPRRSTIDAELPRLPGARAENAAIVRAVRRGQATALQDSVATEARVRELAGDQTVLHFATHAVVREDEPLASFLALSTSGKSASEDGVLTAAEVYGLRLQADLVVLSACRSAAGTIAGDAIATFARAFLYAGTASLVASLWDVADEPTNRLVPAFYRAWLSGANKAVALRRAQLQLLADLRAGKVQVTTPLGPVPIPEHPVFWAGFALFGEPQ